MRHHHRGWVLSWLHHLSAQVPHRSGAVYGAVQMILTPQQMAESILKTLDDVVAEHFPPEEREEAKARILNAWSAEMFQGKSK